MLTSLLRTQYPYFIYPPSLRLSDIKKLTARVNQQPILQITEPKTVPFPLRDSIFEPDTPTANMSTPDLREAIAAEFDILRRTSSTEPAGTFKARSYEAAIKSIREGAPIRTVDDIPAPKKGGGLNGKLREKVVEFVTTGHMAEADYARQNRAPDSIEAFMNVYGIGPKKALDLIQAGYRTIPELRAAAIANPKLLNKNQRVGLHYYEQLLERIPRTEMDQHANQLMALKPSALEGVIVGSYRRGRPDSGDIDMLIRTADAAVDAPAALAAYVNDLKAAGYIKEVLAQGDHKCLAICQLPGASARRLDLLVTPPEEFPFAVLYFTGSDGFNVRMRQIALDAGFTLNEHGIKHVKTGANVRGPKTERDIFTMLRMEWREPTDRTGAEAAVLIPQ
jgi:DNA polymerase/3'-5' exonuclease PolX